MASIMMLSTMERSPRAPSLYSTALSTMSDSASGVNVSLMPSISKSFTYCLIIEFLGSVSIFVSASRSSGFR